MTRRRIEDGYRRRFWALLALVRPRRLEFGVDLLLERAREKSAREGIALARALAFVYEFTRVRVERRLRLMEGCGLGSRVEKGFAGTPPRFLCDSSLGGLARWLRAAGYEARQGAAGSGDRLLEEAAGGGFVLLTSDSRLLDRRPLRECAVPALWIPSAFSKREQLAMLMRDLGLQPRAARCMACGGELQPTPKESVLARIPPRTALWKNEYFVCAGCNRLFWRGTHWERISGALRVAAGT
ncbi:MAG TPA: Mut7-C RNAse domain-containing protein [Vicinamibacteria bacterium]|jgi:uncharacterized protein with PIN domain|nr:Mut7-C RNAse domain-containing protein [Vicinamibacteria bacterium]